MEHVKLFGMNVMRIKYYFKTLIKQCNQWFKKKVVK